MVKLRHQVLWRCVLWRAAGDRKATRSVLQREGGVRRVGWYSCQCHRPEAGGVVVVHVKVAGLYQKYLPSI